MIISWSVILLMLLKVKADRYWLELDRVDISPISFYKVMSDNPFSKAMKNTQ